MIQRTFDFSEQLKMSEGVSDTKDTREILLSLFPLAVAVEKANLSDDKSGTDYWVLMPSGHKQSVDCKVRATDWWKTHPKEDDIALEIWSMIEQGKIGWTRDVQKRTDYILFLWQDTGRWSLVPFPMLSSIFIKNMEGWCKKYRKERQKSYSKGSHWHSECVFVPRKVIWGEIYTTFGGKVA